MVKSNKNLVKQFFGWHISGGQLSGRQFSWGLFSGGGFFPNTLKKNYRASFYNVNGKIKITYETNNGIVTSVVNHEEDLLEIFGKDIMDETNYERAAQ